MTDTLVILPGMMCDHRLFAPQTDILEKKYRILIPKLAGTMSITDMVSSFLTEWPEQFALAGLSMGGIVAMEVMRQAPTRVSKIALMDTNPFAETPERQKIREKQITQVKAGRLKQVMRDDMKPHYLADTPNKAQILDLCMVMALDLGSDVFIEQSRMLASRRDQTATLAAITVPTLILYGAEDRLCPPDRHLAMHKLIPSAKRISIEGAGHLPCLEKPDETLSALTDWLNM